MHDLKQLAKDAEWICTYMKNGPERRLAAFVRDLTDETPADVEWLANVSPDVGIFAGGRVYYRYGWAITIIDTRAHVTRGRVRAFALAMGLQLREGEG